MDYLFILRDAAMHCSKPETRRALRAVADTLDLAIDQFNRTPSEGNLITLNGAWACAACIAKTIPPEGDPAPLSGGTTPPLLSEGSDAMLLRGAA